MSPEHSGKFSQKQCRGPGACILWYFRDPRIQNFYSGGNHGAASGI